MIKIDYIKLLFLGIFRRQKYKLIAVIVQITMGVFIIIPSLILLFHTVDTESSYIKKYNLNTYTISKYTHDLKTKYFEENDINSLRNEPFISEILLYHSNNKSVNMVRDLIINNIIPAENSHQLRVYLTEANYGSFFNEKLLAGRYFNQEDLINQNRVLLLSEAAAEMIFNRTNVVGEKIDFGKRGLYTVAGVLKNTYKNLNFRYETLDFYIPYTCFIEKNNDLISSLVVKLTDPENEEDIVKLKEVIKDNSSNTLVIADNYLKDLLNILNYNKTLAIILVLFGSFLLLLSYCGNLGITLSFFYRRIKIYGIKVALGATIKSIMVEIFIENFMVYLLGTMAGILLSYPFQLYLNTVNSFYAGAKFSWQSILSVLIISLFFTLFSSIFSILKLCSYSPIMLLKSENI